jgi:hypothetical protein
VADDGSGQDTVELVNSFALTVPFSLRHVWREDRGDWLSKVTERKDKEVPLGKGVGIF